MLNIQQLSKTFYPNTVNEKKIFQGLDLTIEEGEFVTVIEVMVPESQPY